MSAQTYRVCHNEETLGNEILEHLLDRLDLVGWTNVPQNDAIHSACFAAREYLVDAGCDVESVYNYRRYHGGDLSVAKWIDGPDAEVCQGAMEAAYAACERAVDDECRAPVAWVAGDLDHVIILSTPWGPPANVVARALEDARYILQTEDVILSTIDGWHAAKARKGASK